jgi:hypothetical protein
MNLNKLAWLGIVAIAVIGLSTIGASAAAAKSKAVVGADWTAANPHPGTVEDLSNPYPEPTPAPTSPN